MKAVLVWEIHSEVLPVQLTGIFSTTLDPLVVIKALENWIGFKELNVVDKEAVVGKQTDPEDDREHLVGA